MKKFLHLIKLTGLVLFLVSILPSCRDKEKDDPSPIIKKIEWNVPPVTVPSDLSPGITLQRGSSRTVFQKIKDVPWATLQAGDIVFINAGVYHEKILLSESGTSENWIRVVGVPDASGNLPVIDGENANSVGGEHLASGTIHDLNTRSLICVSNRNGRDNWGNGPKYISIENLEIRNAGTSYKFNVDGGELTPYDSFTAGIWVDRIDHFVLRNCIVHDCGSGLFINSKYQDEPNDASISKHILIESNYFYNNGVIGSYLEHNTYVEAIDVVYQYNRYESLIAGAPGSTLKDRSAGTVIRYNWMDASARILDLVESEEGSTIIAAEPSYKESFVYGNIFYNGPNGATSPFHYGGDKYNYSTYRKGTLYFYNNTFVNQADQLSEPGRYYTILFQLPDVNETAGAPTLETIDCRNNIFYNVSNTNGHNPTDFYWLYSSGTIVLGKNWVSPNLQHAQNGNSVQILGEEQLISEPDNDPGFVDYIKGDFALKASSSAVDRGSPLTEYLNINYPLQYQYKISRQSIERNVCGSLPDLGALETCN